MRLRADCGGLRAAQSSRRRRAVGREGFAQFGPVDVEVYRVIAEGDLVVVHSHYKTLDSAGVDIFRFNDEGKIIDHWDVLQQVPTPTASGNDMFSQPT